MTRRMKRRRARNARGRSRRSGAPPRGRSERHEIVPRGRARLDPFHNDVSAGGGIQPNQPNNKNSRLHIIPFFHYYRVQIKMKYLPFQSNFSFSISNKTPSTSPTTRPIFSFPLLSPIRPFIVLHSILHVAFSSRRSSNLFRKLEGFVHDSLI